MIIRSCKMALHSHPVNSMDSIINLIIFYNFWIILNDFEKMLVYINSYGAQRDNKKVWRRKDFNLVDKSDPQLSECLL